MQHACQLGCESKHLPPTAKIFISPLSTVGMPIAARDFGTHLANAPAMPNQLAQRIFIGDNFYSRVTIFVTLDVNNFNGFHAE
jgi:hypothetical protein